MKVGIVGHESLKFTLAGEDEARAVIRSLLDRAGAVLVSGGSPLGGIDIWAEQEADKLGLLKIIHKPSVLCWGAPGGFKERNLRIAEDSDEVHCIVVDRVSDHYTGLVYNYCYHCNARDHIKSGGCWTAKKAKVGIWHVIHQ